MTASRTVLNLPDFAVIDPATVQAELYALLERQRQRIVELQVLPDADWASFARPLENMEDELNRFWSPISHLNAVCQTETLRAAYNDCLPLLSAFSTELGQNRALFERWQALQATAPDEAAATLVRNMLRDFRLSGVDLPDDRKQRFAEISERLSLLSAGFSDHVLDATQAWTLPIHDENLLCGLPESARGLLAALAVARGVDAPWLVTLDFPCYQAVMTHAQDRDLRRTVYEAFVTRASETGPQAGQFDNSGLMAEILALRQELATLLGYDCYAALSLVPKMADSVQQVLDFLNGLLAVARPAAGREFEALGLFAHEALDLPGLAAWDLMYASEKLREARYDLSQETVRPYFPLPRVLAGLFAIAAQLFGIRIAQHAAKVSVWHQDAHYFDVLNAEGELIAGFYIDLYAREGKRGGAWMADCAVRRRQDDGALQLPVAFLTCNFNPPVGERPALLTHEEVRTLFHEFGHGLHHMLTKVERHGVSGINGVPWDAVELPSQFMENWCYAPEGIALISAHVDSGEALPVDMLQRLVAARNFQSAMQMARQIEFALFDMEIHSRDVAGCEIQRILDDVRLRTSVLRPPEWNRFQHAFTHIFSGGYAAGYYSYKWAEVLSADAFSRFEDEGIFNAEVGAAFRDTVLAYGGSRHPMQLFEAFRGREPDTQALLRACGIAEGK